MSSAKNKLQEYFQRNNLELPTYSSVKHHDGRWISSVILTLDKKYVIEGIYAERKRAAECSAAQKALDEKHIKSQLGLTSMEIRTRNVPQYPLSEIIVPKTKQDSYTYVLVDYENTNKIPTLDRMDIIRNDLTILRFVSHCHPKASTNEANYIVESSIADAVDHYISFYIGCLCTHLKNDSLCIFVLSRDHFASAIPSFVDGYDNITISHCATEQKCIRELEKIGIHIN